MNEIFSYENQMVCNSVYGKYSFYSTLFIIYDVYNDVWIGLPMVSFIKDNHH